MTYDPYDAKNEKDRSTPVGKADKSDTTGKLGKADPEGTVGNEERALRSERGSKPATPVVPLSESDPAAAVGTGREAGQRPARPTTTPPPVTPPGAAPATPHRAAPPKAKAPSTTAPATAPATAGESARESEKDPFAGPVQDPVHPMSAHDKSAGSTPAPPTRETAPGRAPESSPTHPPRLIPQDECDKLNLRLQEALSTFVDGPRRSVEEAAGVLEEAAKRLTKALADQPRTLRDSWDAGGGKNDASGADTEDLRLALRSYREVTERLLRI